jgi:uncharacterized protein (TIGR00369 family)
VRYGTFFLFFFRYLPHTMYFENKVAESFAQQGFMKLLGSAITKMENGECHIELPYREELTQQNNFFHAGVVGTMADTAAGFATYSLHGNNTSVLTVEYKLNLLLPAKGELLIAEARIIKPGRTLTISHVDVFVVDNGVKTLCAIATVTLMAKKG